MLKFNWPPFVLKALKNIIFNPGGLTNFYATVTRHASFVVTQPLKNQRKNRYIILARLATILVDTTSNILENVSIKIHKNS